MLNKGLCSTCASDASCTFPRKFPLVFCEEFGNDEPRAKNISEGKRRVGKPVGEITEEE